FVWGRKGECLWVVLGAGGRRPGATPQLPRTDARREAGGELLPIDQPVRLRVATDERGREEHRGRQNRARRHPRQATKTGAVAAYSPRARGCSRPEWFRRRPVARKRLTSS